MLCGAVLSQYIITLPSYISALLHALWCSSAFTVFLVDCQMLRNIVLHHIIIVLYFWITLWCCTIMTSWYTTSHRHNITFYIIQNYKFRDICHVIMILLFHFVTYMLLLIHLFTYINLHFATCSVIITQQEYITITLYIMHTAYMQWLWPCTCNISHVTGDTFRCSISPISPNITMLIIHINMYQPMFVNYLLHFLFIFVYVALKRVLLWLTIQLYRYLVDMPIHPG